MVMINSVTVTFLTHKMPKTRKKFTEFLYSPSASEGSKIFFVFSNEWPMLFDDGLSSHYCNVKILINNLALKHEQGPFS